MAPQRITITLNVILLVLSFAACTYDPHFRDCAIHCTSDTGCPNGLSCMDEKLCRTGETSTTCLGVLGDAGTNPPPSSCNDLPATCGPTGSNNCCESPTVPDGTFYRSYDIAADGLYPSTSYLATVSAFRFDAYEATVGRFRKFVEASQGTQESPPIAGAGEHVRISSSGWDPSWNSALTSDTATLIAAVKCHATWQTWTDVPGTNENLPMNCVTWYEAMAFCAWDGGYLPSEMEWNYAAAGGNEQRAYPWSSPAGSTTIDCAHANYNSTSCVNGTNRVGSESPTGDGKWGQSDLAGNVWEWTLDWSATAYPVPCSDCANLTPSTSRVFRGGSYLNDAPTVRVGDRVFFAPSFRGPNVGVRCARLLP
jgi:sulfatase modifying factor 1